VVRFDSILDVNCFVGFWPFRRIRYRTVGDIARLMARTHTRGALVTPLAGLFYKDCLSAVREMLEELKASPRPNLWPVAVVNPAFPGWQKDLAIMIDEWGCVAARLFPNYHGYWLTDPQAEELLRVVQGRGLPLMVSMRVEDERLRHWLVRVEPVSCLDVAWVLRAFPAIKIVLCDVKPEEIDQLQVDILTHPHASVDTSARMPQLYLEEMVGQLGTDRVVYGTGMPLKYPECALHQVHDAQLPEDTKCRVFSENARAMFGLSLETMEAGR
jgi:predicted TIM-barrel fold metal-dependent hydrolase